MCEIEFSEIKIILRGCYRAWGNLTRGVKKVKGGKDSGKCQEKQE